MDDQRLGQRHVQQQVGMTGDLERDVHSERSGDLHVLSHEQGRAAILLSDGDHPLLDGAAVGPCIALTRELQGHLARRDRSCSFRLARRG